MKTIWKYDINMSDDQTVMMTDGAEIIALEMHEGTLCLWAIIDTYRSWFTSRRIRIVGTGYEIVFPLKTAKHIGTVLENDGEFVWHVFDCGEVQ